MVPLARFVREALHALPQLCTCALCGMHCMPCTDLASGTSRCCCTCPGLDVASIQTFSRVLGRAACMQQCCTCCVPKGAGLPRAGSCLAWPCHACLACARAGRVPTPLQPIPLPTAQAANRGTGLAPQVGSRCTPRQALCECSTLLLQRRGPRTTAAGLSWHNAMLQQRRVKAPAHTAHRPLYRGSETRWPVYLHLHTSIRSEMHQKAVEASGRHAGSATCT